MRARFIIQRPVVDFLFIFQHTLISNSYFNVAFHVRYINIYCGVERMSLLRVLTYLYQDDPEVKLYQRRGNVSMRHLLFCLQLMVGVLYVLQSSSAGKVCNTKCPQNCLCLTPKQIQCINVSLTKIPKHISESVSLMDLSRNPALRIEKKSFEKFRVLTTLRLESCNLNVLFTVPRNLRYAFLSDNKLNYNQFYTTFLGGSVR